MNEAALSFDVGYELNEGDELNRAIGDDDILGQAIDGECDEVLLDSAAGDGFAIEAEKRERKNELQ